MNTKITRRDLLNGMVIGTGGVLLPTYGKEPTARSWSGPSPESLAEYYPPTLTGMRGSHEGSFEVAHALAWQGQKPTA